MGNHFTHTRHGYIAENGDMIIHDGLMNVKSALCIALTCNDFDYHSCIILNTILDNLKPGSIAHCIDKDIGFATFFTISAVYVIFYGISSQFNVTFFNNVFGNTYNMNNMSVNNGRVYSSQSYGSREFTANDFKFIDRFDKKYFTQTIFAQFNVHIDNFIYDVNVHTDILWNSFRNCRHIFMQDMYKIIEQKYIKYSMCQYIHNIIIRDLSFIMTFSDNGYLCNNTIVYYENRYPFINRTKYNNFAI